MVRFVLCLLASASATVLPRSGATPLLALRGGAYPPPKAGYHALAAKGAAAPPSPHGHGHVIGVGEIDT